MSMRIISGDAKGRKVRHDRSDDLRPTASKVREALFNILGEKIVNARFLDLFAGTGAVGLEALSRGASFAIFVEYDRRRVSSIEKYVREFGLEERADVICADALKYLSTIPRVAHSDVVFADPPYAYEQFDELFRIINTNDILAEGGILIVEHSSKKRLGGEYVGLALVKEYRYGDTMLSRYRRMI